MLEKSEVIQDKKPASMSNEELRNATIKFPIIQNIDKYEKLNDKHPFVKIKNFFTKEECEDWLTYAKDVEKNFTNPNYTPEAAGMPHVERQKNFIISSFHQFTSYELESQSLPKALLEKLSKYAVIDKNLLQMNLAVFSKGGRFKPHHDWEVNNYTQRTSTFLIYLNSVDSSINGGATLFHHHNKLRITPEQGTCIFWMNTDVTGKIKYTSMLHEGEEITGDVQKWIIVVHTKVKSLN